MAPRLPAYFDALIAAFHAGLAGRDVHLGYWDDPAATVTPASFAAAQARLTAQVVDAIGPRPGQRILDIGCGLGGTLSALNRAAGGLDLVGANIDRRQIAICRTIAAGATNRVGFVLSDACALPFADASFDRICCVEAMFHFASRARFLAEAARLLKPGGRLVVTDILASPPGAAAPWSDTAIAAIIRRDYGPWPDVWTDVIALRGIAADAGLVIARDADWTAATLPSYGVVSPDPYPARNRNPDAGAVFRWLHASGFLSYRLMVLRRG